MSKFDSNSGGNFFRQGCEAEALLDEIARQRRYAAHELADLNLRLPGLYIWWHKSWATPAYVGIALNKKGIYGRVVAQHLNPKYLERRSGLFKNKRIFIDGDNREFCEKSVFRRKISDYFGLSGGAECVEFLKENFQVNIFTSPETDMLAAKPAIGKAEKFLISLFEPRFNTKHRV